jgi:hypothetical protein
MLQRDGEEPFERDRVEVDGDQAVQAAAAE